MYVLIFFFMAIRGARLSLKSYRLNRSSSDKGLNIGIFIAILVFILETGHSGYTFDYPNYQMFGFLIASSLVIYRKNVNNLENI